MNAPAISARPVAEDVYVAPQLEPEHLAQVAKAGFRSVINNRPDMEGGAEQPTSAQMAEAAKAAGLEYRHLPVDSGYQTPEEAQALGKLLAELPRPVLMFCRSGARSARLFAAATSGN